MNSVVIPVLLYGSESWIVSAQDLQKLEVAQMQWLHCILGVTLFDRYNNSDIRLQCCNQPPVQQVITRNWLHWFGHLCRMEDQRVPKKLFWSKRPTGWKCPPQCSMTELEKRCKNQIYVPEDSQVDSTVTLWTKLPEWLLIDNNGEVLSEILHHLPVTTKKLVNCNK